MNKEHPNINVLKKLDLTNIMTNGEVLAEDFVWHYINPELKELEGDYLGLSGLTDFFNKLAGRTNGSFKVNPISTIPLGDHLVVTLVKDTMLLENRPIEIEAVVVWCIANGKIKEAWDIPVVHTAKVIKS